MDKMILTRVEKEMEIVEMEGMEIVKEEEKAEKEGVEVAEEVLYKKH